MAFDTVRLEVSGPAVPVLEVDVRFSVADEGSMVYLQGTSDTLAWVDLAGHETAVLVTASDELRTELEAM